ncbi:MAG: glycosyltransferase family 2 protein [Gammaproteobacteria bacterium]|nr:glycosyltransferase family 2 protein [Gammaproteobacteria bacterium]MDX2488600.1 glycosyltransferase family 2 protein [Gammaproteobacteria bacterium]
MNSFAVVIPAYLEEGTIRDVAERSIHECDSVIVVDDGSSDGTSEVLKDLPLTVLRNETNMGKAASLWRGMQEALAGGIDGVITLDADGQHRPEDIPKLIQLARDNPETIIIGSRLHDRDAIPVSRYRANRFANFWIAWASGFPIEDSQSGFRYYPASLLKSIKLDTSREKSFVFESEVLIEAGSRGVRTKAVQIPAIYGTAMRPSHFQSVKDIMRITRMVAGRLFRNGMNLPGFYRVIIAKEQ